MDARNRFKITINRTRRAMIDESKDSRNISQGVVLIF